MRTRARVRTKETTGKKRKQAHSEKHVTFAWRALGEKIKRQHVPCFLFLLPKEKAKARTLTRPFLNFYEKTLRGRRGMPFFVHVHGPKRPGKTHEVPWNTNVEERMGRSLEVGLDIMAANSDAKLSARSQAHTLRLDGNTMEPHTCLVDTHTQAHVHLRRLFLLRSFKRKTQSRPST